MPPKTAAKKNSRPRVTRSPWRVTSLQVLPRFQLAVEFADGTKGVVELEKFLFASRPGVFRSLRDPAKFAKAFVHPHGYVTWPGGQDLAPDAMYDDIKKTGRRVAGQFEEE